MARLGRGAEDVDEVLLRLTPWNGGRRMSHDASRTERSGGHVTCHRERAMRANEARRQVQATGRARGQERERRGEAEEPRQRRRS